MDTTDIEIKAESLKSKIDNLDSGLDVQKSVTRSWTHLLKKYKEDILCLKIKNKRWKNLLNKNKAKIKNIDKRYQKLREGYSNLRNNVQKLDVFLFCYFFRLITPVKKNPWIRFLMKAWKMNSVFMKIKLH